MTGPYITGEITIVVDKEMSIGSVYRIKSRITEDIMERIHGVKDLIILAEPESE
jgi:divalent metal cation (Fe/Co/Zn/Cd) transporter